MNKLRITILILLFSLIQSLNCENPAVDEDKYRVATPVFTLNNNISEGTLELEIGCSTEDALIYYTVDGTEPSEESILYSAPVPLVKSMTIMAIAIKDEMIDSSIASLNYVVEQPPEKVANPVITPVGGTYESAFSTNISCATEGASIHYTTDGTEPTVDSDLYEGPISVTESVTIKAIAVRDGMISSDIVSAEYIINIPPPVTETIIAELNSVFHDFDITETIPQPAIEGIDMSILGTYDLYLKNVYTSLQVVNITEDEGTLHCTITNNNFNAGIQAIRTCSTGTFPPDCIGPSIINGDLQISTITMIADVTIVLDEYGNITSYTVTPQTTFTGIDMNIEGDFDILMDYLEMFLHEFEIILNGEMNAMIESVLSEY